MLKESLVITALSAASACLCNAATVDISVDTNNTIAGVVANSIIADGEGADWTSIKVLVNLTAGEVYNGAPDSHLPQSVFWSVPGFNILEWDTWFGVPGDPTNGIAGNFGDLGVVEPLVSPQGISITVFNTKTTDTAPVRVSNISLSADAQGTWRMINAFAGGVSVHTDGVVINGVMVPEPSALALLAAGVLALMNRAYKEQPTC